MKKKAATDVTEAASEKPAHERKPRSVPRVRKYRLSPAGHFQDATMLMLHRLATMDKRVRLWAKQNGAAAELVDLLRVTTAAGIELAESFGKLAALGFKPARGPAGKRIPTFSPLQQVKVSKEGLELLNIDFPTLQAEHPIHVATTYRFGEKTVPLVTGTQFLGRVSYKFLNTPEKEAA